MQLLYKIFFILFVLSVPIQSYTQIYFQQEVNNKINVELNDKEKTLSGNIQIEYINNSPESLDYIYIHLWPNAYKNIKTDFADQQLNTLRKNSFHKDKKKIYQSYIDSLDFFVNDKKAELTYFKEDIGILTLPSPLLSGDTIYIKTGFFIKIPAFTKRMGYTKDFFSITQWFPKPAVFDIHGWHPMSYLNIGEFYSEFGSYDVSITLRDDYIVAATGNLVTPEEISRLNNYADLCNNAKDNSNLPKFGDPRKTKTIRFIENNIHDFAWFAYPDFAVKKDTVILKNSGNIINCWTFYDKEYTDYWTNAINYVKNSVSFLSENIGNYPYNNCIVVSYPRGCLSNSGAMEYPTITILGEGERVIAHEIAHNWFYGILASNERNNPWIDEGFACFFENKYLDYYYPDRTFSETIFGKNLKLYGWNKLPSRFLLELSINYLSHENIAQKPSLSSEEFSVNNYYTQTYKKTALALYTLEEFLGEEEFKSLIQGFYETYKFKHIYPENIKKYFTENTDKDINWFFDDLIYSTKKTDYKVVGLKNDSIIIKNKGKTQTPLFLHIGDSLIISDGFYGKKQFPINGNNKIVIDKDFKTLDYNRGNNFYSVGFFKKSKPIKISVGNIVDNPLIAEFPILPTIAYNYSDGFMAGLLFYTTPIPKRKFEYQIMPMWALRSETITGFGNISFYLHPQKTPIKEYEFFASARRFAIDNQNSKMYHRVSSGIKIKLRTDLKGQYISEFLLRNILATDYYSGNLKNFQQIKYSFSNVRIMNPYSYSLSVERGKGFIKSYIEVEGKMHYNYKMQGLKIRVFAGKFLYSSKEYYGNYNFRLAGNLGSQDYLYDHLFIGRNEDLRYHPDSFLAHQFIKNEGGFTLYTPLGQSDNWLAAINLESDTPLRPIAVYCNVGVFPDSTKVRGYYEIGIKVSILKDFINIYFPITGTRKMWTVSNDIYTEKYIQKIRFTLSLEKINLFNYRNKPYLFN